MKVTAVKDELERFKKLIKKIPDYIEVEEVAPYLYMLNVKGALGHEDPEKDIRLSIMSAIHGNEVAGISIVSNVLEFIATGAFNWDYKLALGVGNYEAALQNVRYVDRDLNRSFCRNSRNTLEEQRAQELEKVLMRSEFLIDYHQTIMPSQRPFFIFPFAKKAFKFAQLIAPRQDIITHWGGNFSAEGTCSDELVNNTGGGGVTIETGQNGFDPIQISYGSHVAINAMRLLDQSIHIDWLRFGDVEENAEQGIFTWAHVLKCSTRSQFAVKEGFINFQDVAANELLAMVDGKEQLSPCGGKVLFPKYNPKLPDASEIELCRLVKEIKFTELPLSK